MNPRVTLSALMLGIICLAPRLEADDPASQSSDEAKVRERTQAYQEALRILDLQTAYRMETGALDGSLTANAFRRRIMARPSELIDYEIKAVAVENGKATVEFQGRYQYPQLHAPVTASSRVEWSLIDGQWYRNTVERGLGHPGAKKQ